ncbi:MAG TPA: transporter substrate-binding domain-containing protein [Actinomycetota bacterium]
MRRLRFSSVVVLLSVLTLVTAACASNDNTGGGGGTGSPAASSPTAANDLLASIMSKGYIEVSTDPKYPPQSFLDTATNTWKGFDIDVATEIAKRLGVDVKWQTPNWTAITSGNWQGRWDMSVGSMTITPDRAKVLDFTSPYYYTPAGFAVYKTNTSITSAADLTGKKVGVCGGCTYEEYLRGTLQIPDYPIDFQVKDAEIVTYDTDSTAIQDLALGDCVRLCAAFSAIPTLQGAIDAGKPIKIVGPPLYYEPLGVAFDRESALDATALVQKVSDIITQMHEDGTLSQLSQKWYNEDLTVAQSG